MMDERKPDETINVKVRGRHVEVKLSIVGPVVHLVDGVAIGYYASHLLFF